MKTKERIELTSEEKVVLTSFVNQWEKMGKAFFWSPPGNASGRRSYENYNSDSIDITIDGIRYFGEIKVTCSCKNIYVDRTLRVNGEVKRITALKKLLK